MIRTEALDAWWWVAAIQVLPLHLLDLRDSEMMEALYKLLGRQPHVVEHYLNSFVFPETMEHQVGALAGWLGPPTTPTRQQQAAAAHTRMEADEGWLAVALQPVSGA